MSLCISDVKEAIKKESFSNNSDSLPPSLHFFRRCSLSETTSYSPQVLAPGENLDKPPEQR